MVRGGLYKIGGRHRNYLEDEKGYEKSGQTEGLFTKGGSRRYLSNVVAKNAGY